ncbi:MAG: US12 family protein [Oscillospiraceae bacterium]|nr:US12 family protein [Oscillospiraceae bacterium]
MAALNHAQYRQARFEVDLSNGELTAAAYNAIIGLVVIWGMVLNFVMARFFMPEILSLSPIATLIIYFVGSIGGMLVVYKSKSAVISFVGFTVLAAAMGLILTYYVTAFTAASVSNAFLITMLVSALMIALAVTFPQFFIGIGRILMISLLVGIVLSVLAMLLLPQAFTILDAGIALIFSGFIGFDWARAQQYPKTVDNAVDSAADIYVDVVNLFIRILSIFGHSSSKD